MTLQDNNTTVMNLNNPDVLETDDDDYDDSYNDYDRFRHACPIATMRIQENLCCGEGRQERGGKSVNSRSNIQ